MVEEILPRAEEITAADQSSARVATEAARRAPVVWLIGKVQSGKTSIVRAVTGSSDAEIGTGFKACTATARVFDFPSDAPMLRFLDTRGLGEAGYDPAEDLRFAEGRAQVLLVVLRAMDLAQDVVVEAVRAVRKRHPDWPVVVAQTCLHDGYTVGQTHVLPYPFGTAAASRSADSRSNDRVDDIAPDLTRCLARQRATFSRLPGSAAIVFVPLDVTTVADGMAPADYGLEALCDALIGVAPAAMRAALEALPSVTLDEHDRRADPIILGHAMAAAGSDLVPFPGVGAVGVSAIQARLLQRLGQLHGVAWDRRTLAELSAAIGTGVAARTLAGMGARQLAKMIPVYGQTIATATAAAMSFAVTYALGKAASYFLDRRRRGLAADGTASAYQEALRDAFRIARDRGFAGRSGSAAADRDGTT